jgi:hypothetical protein
MLKLLGQSASRRRCLDTLAAILKLRRICLMRKAAVKVHFEKKLTKINAETRTLTPLI